MCEGRAKSSRTDLVHVSHLDQDCGQRTLLTPQHRGVTRAAASTLVAQITVGRNVS